MPFKRFPFAEKTYKLLYASQVAEPHNLQVKPKPLAIGMMIRGAHPIMLIQQWQALLSLDYPKELLHLRWTVQGKGAETKQLRRFKKRYKKQFGSIEIVKNKYVNKPMTDKAHPKQALWWRRRADNLMLQCQKLTEISEPYDLVMWDIDVFPPVGALNRLLEDQALGADVAAAMCVVATNPPFLYSLNAYLHFLEERGDIMLCPSSGNRRFPLPSQFLHKRFAVSGVGMGCTLVSREIQDKVGWTRLPRYGVDFSLGLKMKEAGYLTYADLGLVCDHAGRYIEVWPTYDAGWVDLYYRIVPKIEDFYRHHISVANPELKYLAQFTRLNIGYGITPMMEGEATNLELTDSDVNPHQLPYKDGEFDLVYAWHLLDHVDNPLTAVKELFRVSRDRVESWTDGPLEWADKLNVPRMEFPYHMPFHKNRLYMTAWHKIYSHHIMETMKNA